MTEVQILQGVADLRAEPSRESERVSQAIYGETLRAGERRDGWLRVQTPDGYEGWVREMSVASAVYGAPTWRVTARFATLRDIAARPVTLAPFGAQLVGQSHAAGGAAVICAPDGESLLACLDDLEPLAEAHPTRSRILAAVDLFAGVPYLWGGRTPFGVDCSGFTQAVWTACGLPIPRDAYQQADCEIGTLIDPDRMTMGDLVFFRSDRHPHQRRVTHTGIVLDDGLFADSSGLRGVTIRHLVQITDPIVCARRLTTVSGT